MQKMMMLRHFEQKLILMLYVILLSNEERGSFIRVVYMTWGVKTAYVDGWGKDKKFSMEEVVGM